MRSIFDLLLPVVTMIVALSTAVRAEEGEDVWKKALEAPLVTLSGSSTTLGETLPERLGKRGAVLLVWSLYQPESRRALRDLEVFLDDAGKERPAVCAIAIPEYREGLESISSFLGRAKIRLPVFVDPKSRVPDALAPVVGKIEKMPHAIWVSPEGEVRSIAVGWRATFREDLERATRGRGETP